MGLVLEGVDRRLISELFDWHCLRIGTASPPVGTTTIAAAGFAAGTMTAVQGRLEKDDGSQAGVLRRVHSHGLELPDGVLEGLEFRQDGHRGVHGADCGQLNRQRELGGAQHEQLSPRLFQQSHLVPVGQ